MGCTCVTISHRPALVAFHDLVLALDGEGGWTVHKGVNAGQAGDDDSLTGKSSQSETCRHPAIFVSGFYVIENRAMQLPYTESNPLITTGSQEMISFVAAHRHSLITRAAFIVVAHDAFKVSILQVRLVS